MGMTDRQFDAYQSLMLNLLKKADQEIKEKGESKQLTELIASIEAELQRP